MGSESCKQLLRSLADKISYIADVNTYEMRYMSKSAMELFGFSSPEEYQDHKCYQLLHGMDHPCMFCMSGKVLAQHATSRIQYNEKLSKWLVFNEQLEIIDGTAYRVVTMQELQQQRLWSPELTEQLTMESILLQCIQTLSANPDMDAAISAFLEMVGRFYCADRAYIFEFDLETQMLHNTFEWCAAGVSSQIDHLQNLPMVVVDTWLTKFYTTGEFFISSIDTDLDPNSLDHQLLMEQQVNSLMAAPLYSDGQIVGFIGVDDPDSNIDNTTLLRATTSFVTVELDKRRILKALEHLSYTDSLTELYNRNKYKADLIRYYKHPPRTLGIILVDINGLSEINNSCGHQYGDSIIIQTAQLIKALIPFNVYRSGGDEFIVFCPDVDQAAFHTMLSTLSETFHAASTYSVSIGYSWRRGDVDVDLQLLQAEAQMHVEKQTYYQSSYVEGQSMGSNPAADILQEIEDNRFIVYYQPKVDLSTKQIVGAEALVRKLDEDGSIIPPSQFIPHYEARNVLMHVDFFVLNTTLSTVRKLRDAGIDIYISINFSRSTLMVPDFVSIVLSACENHGVPPTSIMLEVTESIAAIDRDRLLALLQEIRQAGLRLSLDDFGSKYSNTAILADIEFDEVKLDKSLVDNICQNPRSLTILKNLIGMCRELENALVVAEGIESADQAALLEQLSCDCGQGYFFYRPMPLDQFTHLVEHDPQPLIY